MKVTYLHHSSFLVELSSCYLLFDYTLTKSLPITDEKPLYVFASHGHADHFDRHIFDLQNIYEEVHYILSDDIDASENADVKIVKACNTYVIGDMKVETLHSTDQGVAFVIDVDDRYLYFAGDLNWWDWGEEDTIEEAFLMQQDYEREMEKLKGQYFHVAFIPVDPRLKSGYWKGLDTFMKYAQAQHILCMHFWNQYAIQEKMISMPCARAYRQCIEEIKWEGQQFIF